MDWFVIGFAVGLILTGALIGGVIVDAFNKRAVRTSPPRYIARRCKHSSHRRQQ